MNEQAKSGNNASAPANLTPRLAMALNRLALVVAPLACSTAKPFVSWSCWRRVLAFPLYLGVDPIAALAAFALLFNSDSV